MEDLYNVYQKKITKGLPNASLTSAKSKDKKSRCE